MRKANTFVFVTILCVGVLLQMLGTPITLWNLDGLDDDFVSVLLMGIAVHSTTHHPPLRSYLITPLPSAAAYAFRHEHTLFRPPLFAE
jgi:hypothetical protein